MKLSQVVIIAYVLAGGPVAMAQTTSVRAFELGIKGGGTFTHGSTSIAAQTVGGVNIPAVENKTNGIGMGYSGGLWARKNVSNFFIQAEATYNRFVVKQKTNATLDVNASASLANALPVSVQPSLLTATVDVVSESVLETVNVSILVGKRWLDGKLRGYAGPSFIFIHKAEATRTTSGVINANSNVSFPQTDIPATTGKTNLLNRYEVQNLEVRDFTIGLEAGASYSPIPSLDIDLRYLAPVGGFYRDASVKGFVGMATLSLGFKVF
ncbi:outer membrane beta-barrel protein [Spirosoma areae]